MDKQKSNGKMKMLQVPITEKQFETLKEKVSLTLTLITLLA